MINLIAGVTLTANYKLAIGRNGDLLFKITDDMKFFKNITTSSLRSDSKLEMNVVLMGRKTYFSIPAKHRPLKNRINIVLTRDHEYIGVSPIPSDLVLDSETLIYFTDLPTFEKIYKKYNPNVFVIGGSKVYDLFMPRADKLYITHIVNSDNTRAIKFSDKDTPDTFIDLEKFTNFDLIGYSEKYFSEYNGGSISYRVLYYTSRKTKSPEYQYLDLLSKILESGTTKSDRTGTGTKSIFGSQIRFDISKSIPLLTTKKVPFGIIIEELLWFCRGDTDTKILDKKGIKIWNGNSTREFLDNRGLEHYPEGVIGPQYGFLWRHFGAPYDTEFANTSTFDTKKIGGFDQLKYVEDLLERDPFSRRIIMTAWNPAQLNEQALPPCHMHIQFCVTEEFGVKHLSCMFMMRSSDNFLACCWNTVFYTILTYILAAKHNMKPKEIIYVAGDTHIYLNHINQVKKQLSRTPRPFPALRVSPSIKTKDWSEMTTSDFELIGYFPDRPIVAPMAI